MKKKYFILLATAFGFYVISWSQPTSYGGKIEPVQNTAGTGGDNTSSYFGHEAGINNTGTYNTFIGFQSGLGTTTGIENSALGALTLGANTIGNRNTANGIYALANNIDGSQNTGIGYGSLGYNTSGSANTAIGTRALETSGEGNNNTAIGYEALRANYNTTNNIAIGYQSAWNNINGSQNTFIGSQSGYNNQGSGNVFIGYQAGYNEASSNRLYIDNSGTASPLISGDFSTDELRFNGIVVIGTNQNPVAGYHLTVGGDIIAEKVKVAVNGSANWSDYVFEDDYKLRSLSEVEKFIKQNKHLPGIPSAEEMVKQGLDVARMDAKLLEKIEELTLYMIEMKKEIVILKKENTALKAAIANPKQ